MGLAGSLIGVAFFLIVIVFAITFFSAFFTNVFAFIEDFFEQQANKAKNRDGSTVCDLRFKLWGAFDEAGFGLDLETDQRLYLGRSSPNSGGQVFHPEVAVADFDRCYTEGSGTFLQLLPVITTENFDALVTQLAFTNITDLEFTITMEFIRTDDGRSIGTKTMVVKERSLSDLPFTFDTGIRVFADVELTRYDVEVTCGGDCTKINNLANNEPFIYKIRFG
ncbi:MAG: hypothetical protein KJI69_03830 [Patescibacteria group bacterium]|nr:hypothetical protein [Patescibacteria group bacterium]